MEPPYTRASDIVCVLGPPRCGTSLTTRLLGLLGLYLGPDERIRRESRLNETGTWEHSEIWEIDRAVMDLVAGWSWPVGLPEMPPGWWDAPELEALKQRARAVVDRDFGAVPLWGWKHPLTCLTLPFWQAVLPPIRTVVCARDPVEAATSMAGKWPHSFEQGLYVWLRHMRAAFQHSEGRSRHLVFYDDWFGGDSGQLEALAGFLRGSEVLRTGGGLAAAP